MTNKSFLNVPRQQPTQILFCLALLLLGQYQASASSPFSRRRQQHRHLHAFQRRRNLVMFGTMDHWIQQRQEEQRVLLASTKFTSSVDYRPPPMEEEVEYPDDGIVNDKPKPRISEIESPPLPIASEVEQQDVATPSQKQSDRAKMWPPWPFNLLQRSKPDGSVSNRQGPVVRMGSFVFGFFGQRARVSIKELQDIGSRLWFHLPPMTPPILLLALLPRQEAQMAASAETGVETVVTKTVIPLLSNSLARTLVLTGFSLAVMSWAHSEINRLRRLTPLPLNGAYRKIHSAVLPHVLPEEVSEPFLLEEDEEEDEQEEDEEEEEVPIPARKSSSISKKLSSSVPPRLQKHFKQFGSSQQESKKNGGSNNHKKTPTWRKNMKRMREARRAEAQKVRRMAIYDELVALQAIKRKAVQQQQGKKQRKPKAEEPLGYALVTGASRGIGRAIAVELARWEIPLILVARDLTRLTSLAYDLEACYGIKCCVLQADLSQPHAAEQIHQATQEAGLVVDILVNNAGISYTGLAVDMPLHDVDRMIRVNGVAVAHLAHLYGKDMKERRRGRILMVSSVVGAVSAGPTVAMYAATKAFEKVLGLSLAKELEPYGVGVTCLMPGAVRDTDFRSSSTTHEALCWKIPGYPKAPSRVAAMGIRALLTGNVEVTPGWQNRAFLKVFQPAIPQRLHNILVEIAWNPLMVPPFLKFWKTPENRRNERQKQLENRNKQYVEDVETPTTRHKPSAQEWRPRSNMNLPPPLLLSVPGDAPDASPTPIMDAEPELPKHSLVGPDPVVETPDSVRSENEPSTPVDDTSAKSLDDTGEQATEKPLDQYEELRKLTQDIDSPTTSESTDPSVVSEPTESTTSDTESSRYPQQVQQHQPERHVLQLQEQVLKLQEQVQAQERQQFLQQMELERRQREFEYEKRDMEWERERQNEKARDRGSERRSGWRRRNARPSDSEPPAKKDVTPKPRVTKIAPRHKEEPRERDLMSESLEHPLLAPSK